MPQTSMPLEKLDHGRVEGVVAVACEHMCGSLYVQEFGVRDQFLKVAHIFHRDDFTLRAAQQQRGNSNSASCFGVALLGLISVRLVSREKSLIPVPVVSAILAQSQIALQTGKVCGSWPMWQVLGNRIGSLLEVGKSLRVRPHESQDARASFPVDPRRDIDQDQR